MLRFSGSPTQLNKEARLWRVRCERLYCPSRLFTKSENPTHGSEWMVSDPFYNAGVGHLVNPTNGSWWIVQISSNWSALSFCSPIYALEDRKDLNHPPTAVGGIFPTLRVRS